MSVREQLNDDLKAALRSGDESRKSAIRLLLASIHNAEIQAAGHQLDDAAIIGLLSREVRQRRESIAEFRKAGRDDLVAREETGLAVVVAYLPPQLTQEEIVAAASDVIRQVGAKGPADRGRVMAAIMTELRGKADGSEISAVVGELLSQLPA